ncbi:MAG TPA: CxxxxCH/CxxCH domain-containing protein [Kofleriaceae bacterium]|nr:CxxxxCH/CxxCH domain-containing protein [Kofleriaceae bacterium]
MRWLCFIALLAGCAVEREPATCTDCAAQGVHPAGFADPRMHGKEVERRGWDLALCQSCHGQDYSGNASAPSCLSCHEKRPDACDTCHAEHPTTAAHGAHLAKDVSCSDCHAVPSSWEAHRRPSTREGLVTFGSLAKAGGAMPAWDGAKCTNVYCHGAAQPTWTGGPSQAACGSCHGTPPASHAQSTCATCHTSKHIDGVVDVNTSCNGGCHGDAQSAAPATGAHRAHLRGGFFSQPLACSECHGVPNLVGDAGHIDSAAPAELTFGTLATARGTSTSWDGARCTVYCHGTSTPAWVGTGETDAYCGSCHGLPPTTAPHTQAMTLFDCASCHAQSVGPFGNVLVANGTHMNGVVDAN